MSLSLSTRTRTHGRRKKISVHVPINVLVVVGMILWLLVISDTMGSLQLLSSSSSSLSIDDDHVYNLTWQNKKEGSNVNYNDNDAEHFDTVIKAARNKKPLIDFAIVGFGKCGTTSLMNFLNIPGKTYMGYDEERAGRTEREKCPKTRDEVYELDYGKHGDTHTHIHININTETHDMDEAAIIKGFKCPLALTKHHNGIIENFQDVNPHPKIIASIRHPVTHFESSYNYFYKHDTWDKETRPNPNDLLGHCESVCRHLPSGEKVLKIQETKKKKDIDVDADADVGHTLTCLSRESLGQPFHGKVCTTQSSMFHYALSKLHLTPMTDENELELLDHHTFDVVEGFKGSLFLVETKQFADLAKSDGPENIMRDELEGFIGMEPKTLQGRPFPSNDKYPKLIDICDEEYSALRDELVQRGRKAGRWIIDYLLKSDRVVVHDRDHFIELVEAWGVDPCVVIAVG